MKHALKNCFGFSLSVLLILLCAFPAFAAEKDSEKTVTRANAAVAVWELAGKPDSQEIGFTDVAADKSYYKAVQWAVDKGLLDGGGTAYIRPEEDITGEEWTVMLYRYAKLKQLDVSVGEDTNILSYEDVSDISDGNFDAYQWACGAGIISSEKTVLEPKGKLTEQKFYAELAAFRSEYCGGKATDLSGGTWTKKQTTSGKEYWSYQTAAGIYPTAGWHKISGKWYWFDILNPTDEIRGRAEENRITPDGYYVDASCAWADTKARGTMQELAGTWKCSYELGSGTTDCTLTIGTDGKFTLSGYYMDRTVSGEVKWYTDSVFSLSDTEDGETRNILCSLKNGKISIYWYYAEYVEMQKSA